MVMIVIIIMIIFKKRMMNKTDISFNCDSLSFSLLLALLFVIAKALKTQNNRMYILSMIRYSMRGDCRNTFLAHCACSGLGRSVGRRVRF